MRVVFMGTPEVAVAGLQAILDSSHEITAVVTRPDKPRGRSGTPVPSPVKTAAEASGLVVIQPTSPKDPGFVEALQVFEPEAIAVVAYGHILPPDVLALAPAVNVHFSLLPRYRGAAPVQRALMDGAVETGVSVFMLEPTMDTGPVLFSESIAVAAEETAGDLFARLAPIGARLLVQALDAIERGTHTPLDQDDTAATPAPKIAPAEARIDWTKPAATIVNLVRALNPNPGAYTMFQGKRLNVWRARASDQTGAPGTVVDGGKDRFVVAAGDGAVELVEVQPGGKKRMPGADFARGHKPQPGTLVGSGDDEPVS